MKIDTFGILWYYQRLVHFRLCMEDFFVFTGFITGPLHLKTYMCISPGVLWEGTGQNSLFRDHHCHHSPEQFQLTEKDKKLEGVGWKKTLAKICCYPLYVEIKKNWITAFLLGWNASPSLI